MFYAYQPNAKTSTLSEYECQERRVLVGLLTPQDVSKLTLFCAKNATKHNKFLRIWHFALARKYNFTTKLSYFLAQQNAKFLRICCGMFNSRCAGIFCTQNTAD